MIVGTRKAEGGSGDTPFGKKTKPPNEIEDEQTLSQADKIDKIFDMMTNMQKDVGQTKLLAQTAVQTAELAMSSMNEMKSTMQQLQSKDVEFEKELLSIKQQLNSTPQS